jgi:hypothetical protein
MGIGALLTRLQWRFVKQRVTQEIEGGLHILLSKGTPPVFDPPNATIEMIRLKNDLPPTILPFPAPKLERGWSAREPNIKLFPEAKGFRSDLRVARTNHRIKRKFPDRDPDLNHKQ